jgi:hypothetical protein
MAGLALSAEIRYRLGEIFMWVVASETLEPPFTFVVAPAEKESFCANGSFTASLSNLLKKQKTKER